MSWEIAIKQNVPVSQTVNSASQYKSKIQLPFSKTIATDPYAVDSGLAV
jgi:hypothetical protein